MHFMAPDAEDLINDISEAHPEDSRTGSPLVLCTCRKCSQYEFKAEDGTTQSGRLVRPQTERSHRRIEAISKNPDSQAADTGEERGYKEAFSEVRRNLRPRKNDRENEKHVRQRLQAIKEHGIASETEAIERGAAHEADTKQKSTSIATLIHVLILWLHLRCGLSRQASTVALKVINIVITMAFQLALSIRGLGSPDTDIPTINIKHDVRSAMASLSIEPVLLRSVCCPKCFAQYSLESCPDICPRRETKRSKKCGEHLWTTRNGSNGGPRRCPRCMYTTQSFESWLTWFLSRPGIEDLINESYEHQSPGPGGIMHSIRDSPAWQSFGSFATTRGNLIFSFFIDWFNPLMNKIAGKKISAGAIMLFCQNLPEHLQYAPENTFFAGITPPPNEPSVSTITHVADPVIDQLAIFYTGKRIPTYRQPEGSFHRVALMAFIADLITIRKCGGFASHSAEIFCSFCECLKSQIESLDPGQWRPCNGAEVRIAAGLWRDAQTKKAREALFTKYGIRWSSLHKLLYRDPVHHMVLGVMHNWMEGILQHHARRKWGIGVESGSARDAAAAAAPGPAKAESGDKTFLQPDDESDSDDDSTVDTPDTSDIPSVFNATSLGKICACIEDVILPSWVDRPPKNLGDKAHGKLKADNWFVLFSVMLPMVLVELWTSKHRTQLQEQLLDNFYDLVTCTNIVGAYSTSDAAADTYTEHYISYRRSLQKLFPASPSVPNHHYAMHNGDLLKFWGPLMCVSEFPYEQHNGRLQKIKTNGYMHDLDYTMLRQICRRGRLTTLIQQQSSVDDPLAKAYDLLNANSPSAATDLAVNEEYLKLLKTVAAGETLPSAVYDLILSYLQASGESVRHHLHLPHPTHAVVLPCHGIRKHHFKHRNRDFAERTIHEGNSSITFRYQSGRIGAGFIDAAWLQLVGDGVNLFIAVSIHQPLSEEDQQRSPFAERPGFLVQVFYDRPSHQQVIIRPGDIISHAAIRRRPARTFGIGDPIIIVHDLNRGRN
ncbi:hypothetical protein OE88DRAFT_1791307 [Heliocybe sulcata]|uniref:Uncharacterized protein n=1 Tax=Heliocybe sulcata TaxID=5364 RepID=A0A5C3N8C0_9AGAM|nr:hypothetical protein OE88DRAFT_1791307 [Heliocybe sulcata]